jgi:hypothetical protein
VPRSKNEWSYTSTSPVCPHGVVLSQKKKKKQDRDNFTFTFNGFDVTVIVFVNACFCLLNSFTFLWKISDVFQHIQHALFQDAFIIYLASYYPQQNFPN